MSAATAKTIRRAIKAELGFNARQVSVRASSFSMGSSVSITIKGPAARSRIEAIAKGGERIRRCEVSGEILGGGNLYIDVQYGKGVLAGIYGEYLDDLKALEKDPGKILRLPGAFEEVTVCHLDGYYHVQKGEDYPRKVWGAEMAGEVFAEMLLEDLAAAKEAKEGKAA